MDSNGWAQMSSFCVKEAKDRGGDKTQIKLISKANQSMFYISEARIECQTFSHRAR